MVCTPSCGSGSAAALGWGGVWRRECASSGGSGMVALESSRDEGTGCQGVITPVYNS